MARQLNRPVPELQIGNRAIGPVRVQFADSGNIGDLATRIGRMLGRDQEIEAQRVSEEARAKGLNDGLSGDMPDRSKFGTSIADQAYLRGAEEGALNRLQLSVRQKLDEFSLQYGADVAGFKDAADAYRNGLAKDIPESLRPQFNYAFDHLQVPLLNQATRLAHKQIADERIATFDTAQPARMSAIQRNARVAEIDPAAAAALNFELDGYIQDLAQLGPREAFEWRGRKYEADPGRAAALSLVQLEKRAADADREATENMVMGAWSRGPRTREWIDEFEKRQLDRKNGGGLTEEQVQGLAQRMRGEWAHDEALRRDKVEAARVGLSEDMKDELAHVRTTGKPLNLVDGARIAAAKGDAAGWQRQVEMALKGYEYEQRLALASPDEVAAMRRDLAPKAGAGYARQLDNAQEFDRAILARTKALTDDPAAYVLRFSPALQALAQKAEQDPQAARQALRLSLDAQARLGVPEYARRALTGAQADAMVQTIQSSAPEAMANAMQGLAQRYGADWRRVYGDLVRAKLPDTYQVLGGMADPSARKLLAEAFRSEAEKRGALKDLAGADAKQVTETLRDQFLPFARSLRQAPDGAAIVERHQQAAELLAYRYMQSGLDPSAAAKRAAGAVILERYDFLTGGQIDARVPKGQAGDLERLARDQVNGLKAADLEAPPARQGEKLTDDQRQSAYLRNVQRQGVWVTGPADDRLMLLDGARQPVMRNDGTPIEIPFAGAYGARVDGTRKGNGYFGPLRAADGSVMTELSVGVEIDGKQVEIPAIVPTLSRAELDHLLKTGEPTDAIVDKAVAHARKRIADGKNPFADPADRTDPPAKPRGWR